MEAEGADAQICSLGSFGEHGQTVRGIDLKPIGGCQGRLGEDEAPGRQEDRGHSHPQLRHGQPRQDALHRSGGTQGNYSLSRQFHSERLTLDN